MNIPKKLITPIWLIGQIPIFITIVLLTTMKAILHILRNNMTLVFAAAFLIYGLIATIFPNLVALQYLLIISSLGANTCFYIGFILLVCRALAELYYHHKLLTNSILIVIGLVLGLIVAPSFIANGILLQVISSIMYSGMMLATTIGLYSAFVILTPSLSEGLTNSDEENIKINLKAALGLYKNEDNFKIAPKSLQRLLRSFFSQAQYEKALELCEDIILKEINTEISNKDENPDDFTRRFNYLLAVLSHVMISHKIKLENGSYITKIELTPKSCRWIDSPYFALEVKNDLKKEVIFVFPGTSVLPAPCPGVVWTHFGDFVPLFSIGRPLMWFCSSNIERMIKKEEILSYDKTLVGLSLGGCMARITHEQHSETINNVITYSCPGELSWGTRSIYFTFLAASWLSIVSIFNYKSIIPSMLKTIIGIPCFNTIGVSLLLSLALITRILHICYHEIKSHECKKEIHFRNDKDAIPLIGDFNKGKIVECTSFSHDSCSHFACPSPSN